MISRVPNVDLDFCAKYLEIFFGSQARINETERLRNKFNPKVRFGISKRNSRAFDRTMISLVGFLEALDDRLGILKTDAFVF